MAQVVDVPAIKQLKYQQSFFEFLDVAQIQIIDRLLLLPVPPQRQVRTVQETGVPQCSSWVVVCMPGVYNDKDSAENCGGSAVAVGAVLGTVLTCPLLYYNRCLVVQTVQKTLEVPQLQFINVGSCRWYLQMQVPAVFSAQSEGSFCPKGIFRTPSIWTLSPDFRRTFWGALDDEGFFVVEGSGVAGTPGVRLPGVLPHVN